jgi:formylglycine-generating enzyme required for sulfatase activity
VPDKEEVVKEENKEIRNSIGMKLVRIPAGKFRMGSAKRALRYENETPQHDVEISRPFYLGVCEVTQKQYRMIMGKNPSRFCASGEGKDKVAGQQTEDFPVENVSWDDAVAFCKKLSALAAEKVAGRVYRLPTEAEWEYSCRGGAPSPAPFHFGRFLPVKQANYRDTALGRPCPVGSYEKNGFGLCDMHGNVWEWCSDRYGDNYYANSPVRDPQGPPGVGHRVIRGGAWTRGVQSCRSTYRGRRPAAQREGDLGFRVACPAEQ